MVEYTRAVSEAPTIRAYLAPAQHRALPLPHDFTQDPQTPLDRGFADLTADERLAVRFIIEPADTATVRDFRAQAGLRQSQRLADALMVGDGHCCRFRRL